MARLRSVKTTASSVGEKKRGAFIKVKFARGEYVRTFLHKTVVCFISFFCIEYKLCGRTHKRFSSHLLGVDEVFFLIVPVMSVVMVLWWSNERSPVVTFACRGEFFFASLLIKFFKRFFLRLFLWHGSI